MADYTSKYKGEQIDEAVGKALVGGAGAVTSVNGQTGAVQLDIPDVPDWAMQTKKPTYTASEVGALPSTYTPPNQTAEQVGADPAGTAEDTVGDHNTAVNAHTDIRALIANLKQRLDSLMDCDDTTLDQLSEIVTYIKNNKSIIDSIAIDKLSATDVINNLVTNATNKPLSAAQGVVLKKLVDAISVPTKVSQLTNDSGYLTNQSVNDVLATAKESGEFDGVGVANLYQKTANLEDGGENVYVVELTDGTISNFKVRNGSKGRQGDPGEPGPKGEKPVAGVDYYTEADKAEFSEYIASELAKRGQLQPEYAQSEEWLDANGDTSKLYILPDGMIWANVQTVTEGEKVPNFTNLMDNPNAYIKDKQRYSQSGGGFTTDKAQNDCAIVIPIPSTAGAFKIRVKEATLDGSQYKTSAYFGKDNQKFPGSNDTTNFSYADDGKGTVTFTQSTYNGGYNYFVVHVADGVDEETLIVTLNEEITYTTTPGDVEYRWASTGHAFVPADYEDRIVELEDSANDHESRLKYIEEHGAKSSGVSLEHNTCAIFRKVVCCGDSFTAGYIGTTNDNISQTNWDYAWPSFMARLTGNEYVNCGHSGKNVWTWQESEKGLAKAQSAGRAQAYLIGLGLNDSGQLDLGTVADIGTENRTYYGGLSKLIRELNAISPMAKIFVQTIPSDYVGYANCSEAMRNVVNAYAETYPVYLLDLYEYKSLYKTAKVTGDSSLGHYTPIGYQQFAENLRYVWSDYINQHIADFQDVYLIPYDETPSTL